MSRKVLKSLIGITIMLLSIISSVSVYAISDNTIKVEENTALDDSITKDTVSEDKKEFLQSISVNSLSANSLSANMLRSVGLPSTADDSELKKLIPDDVLRGVVWNALKDASLSPAATLIEYLASFTGEIKAGAKNKPVEIKDISGIQYLRHAERIDLRHNAIADWTIMAQGNDYWGTALTNVTVEMASNPFRNIPNNFGGNLEIAQPAAESSWYRVDPFVNVFMRNSTGEISGTIDIGRCKIDGGEFAKVISVGVVELLDGKPVQLPNPPLHPTLKSQGDPLRNQFADYDKLIRSCEAKISVGIDQVIRYNTVDEFGTPTPGSVSFKYYIPMDFFIYDRVSITHSGGGSAMLTKTDDVTGQALSDAEYSLYRGNVLVKSALLTNSSGQIRVNDLGPGKYVFKETKAPKGYDINPQNVEFTITAPTVSIGGGLSKITTQDGTVVEAGEDAVLVAGPEKALAKPMSPDITLSITPADSPVEITVEYMSLDDTYIKKTFNSIIEAQNDINAQKNANKITGQVNIDVRYISSADTIAQVSHKDSKATVDIAGNKTWLDASESTRPGSITVNLLQNGTVYQTKTVTKEEGWQYKFTGLPKHDLSGKNYSYSISENPIPGYDPHYDGYDILNVDIGNTVVQVRKVWNDYQNAYNTRSEKIIADLYQNDSQQPFKSAELNASNSWKYIFQNLPEHDADGKLYRYTVKESGVPAGYTGQITGSGTKIVTITNTLNDSANQIASVKVIKKWDDKNRVQLRPKELMLSLYRNDNPGAAYKTVTLNAQNNWTYAFDNLPKHTPSGDTYKYSVKERKGPGYKLTENTPTLDRSGNVWTMVLTNTYTGEAGSISGRKVWKDNENEKGLRPEAITVNLLRSGQKIDSMTVDRSTHWEYEFKNLPHTDAAGNVYEYSVSEAKIEGYVTEYTAEEIINTPDDNPNEPGKPSKPGGGGGGNSDNPPDGNVKTIIPGIQSGTVTLLTDVKTGDSIPIILVITILCIALAGIILVASRVRNKKC